MRVYPTRHGTAIGICLALILTNMAKKILFIEDEPALQRAASAILTQEGFQVMLALNGEEGIQTALREKPALILLDLILPKKDGFEVLEALKKDPDTKDIPVIILSNLEGSTDVERAISMGATTYLVKANYRLEEVLQRIREIIGQ